MFVEEIRITKTLPCIAEEGSLQVHAVASAPLTPILPYLNTILKKTNYDHDGGNLTFIIDNRISVFIQNNKLVIRKVVNTTAAYELLDRLKELFNDTYRNMANIEATIEQKKVVSIMDFYKLLPKTNCKKCGVPTCMAFANQLYQEEAVPEDCPVLTEEQHRDNLEKISSMI